MHEKKHIELSVIVPTYNEEASVRELYERVRQSIKDLSGEHEIIFVNDGSADKTLEKITGLAGKDPSVKYISFSRNFGHQTAVTAGLDKCSGNAVVIIDGDLQDPPEVIPELYEKYKQGYQVVYARRKARKGETVFKKLTARWFYRLLKSITSFEIPLDTGDFRLIDKKIVDYLRQMPEQNKFLRGQIAWLGFRQTFVEFERDKRKAGKTNYSFKKMLSFALDGITAFSNKPLKLVTAVGVLVAGIAFVIILWALVSHFFLDRTITGWTSLIISVLFIGGIQIFSIGIIGEYISRINSDVKKRPLYIVEQTNIEEHVK